MNTVTLLLISTSSAVLLLTFWSEYRRLVQQERNDKRICRQEKRIDDLAELIERVAIGGHKIIGRLEKTETALLRLQDDYREIRDFAVNDEIAKGLLPSGSSPGLQSEVRELRAEVRELREKTNELQAKEKARSDEETRAKNPTWVVDSAKT